VSKVVVVTSGKGGVGKTTTSANISTGLALEGKKVVAIDFDVGLRNLDLVMGCERRVVYDFVNVIRNEAKLHQALIKDKRVETLYVLPASQTRDKDALDPDGVGRVMDELKQMGFDYIICDSPAGIERGAQMAMYYADEAIVVTNPESKAILQSSNKGTPAILEPTSDVAQAYLDVVSRFLGEERAQRFIDEEKRGFFGRLFG